MRKTYLGDGVYVELERGMIRLSTQRENGLHVIYLEPEVFKALVDWEAQSLETFLKGDYERN